MKDTIQSPGPSKTSLLELLPVLNGLRLNTTNSEQRDISKLQRHPSRKFLEYYSSSIGIMD
jgi:hypothetical protein